MRFLYPAYKKVKTDTIFVVFLEMSVSCRLKMYLNGLKISLINKLYLTKNKTLGLS